MLHLEFICSYEDVTGVIRMSQEGDLNCDFINFSWNFNIFELLLKITLLFRKSWQRGVGIQKFY